MKEPFSVGGASPDGGFDGVGEGDFWTSVEASKSAVTSRAEFVSEVCGKVGNVSHGERSYSTNHNRGMQHFRQTPDQEAGLGISTFRLS